MLIFLDDLGYCCNVTGLWFCCYFMGLWLVTMLRVCGFVAMLRVCGLLLCYGSVALLLCYGSVACYYVTCLWLVAMLRVCGFCYHSCSPPSIDTLVSVFSGYMILLNSKTMTIDPEWQFVLILGFVAIFFFSQEAQCAQIWVLYFCTWRCFDVFVLNAFFV